MKSLYITLSIVLLLTTACGEKGDSNSAPKPSGKVVSGEPCPESVVDASNRLLTATRAYLKEPSASLLNDMKTECSSLKDLLGEARCKATDLTNGNTVYISYTRELAEMCEEVLQAKSTSAVLHLPNW